MRELTESEISEVSGGGSAAGLGAHMAAGGFGMGVSGAKIGGILGTALVPGAGTAVGGAIGAAFGATVGSVVGAVYYLSK